MPRSCRPGIVKPMWVAHFDPKNPSRYGFNCKPPARYFRDDGMTLWFVADGPIREITHCKPSLRRRVWWDPDTEDYMVIIGDIAWPGAHWDRIGLEVVKSRIDGSLEVKEFKCK